MLFPMARTHQRAQRWQKTSSRLRFSGECSPSEGKRVHAARRLLAKGEPVEVKAFGPLAQPSLAASPAGVTSPPPQRAAAQPPASRDSRAASIPNAAAAARTAARSAV